MAEWKESSVYAEPYTAYPENGPGVLFRGVIKKKSSATFVGFRERMCVVHSAGYLLTWGSDCLGPPKKVFALKGSGSVPESSPANAFALLVDEKVYLFTCSDPKSRIAILQAMDTCRRFPCPPGGLPPVAPVATA